MDMTKFIQSISPDLMQEMVIKTVLTGEDGKKLLADTLYQIVSDSLHDDETEMGRTFRAMVHHQMSNAMNNLLSSYNLKDNDGVKKFIAKWLDSNEEKFGEALLKGLTDRYFDSGREITAEDVIEKAIQRAVDARIKLK